MACITLFAPPLAMATTELVRAIHYESASICPMEANVDRKPLSMSWVVVTGNNGARQLRMRWASAESCRCRPARERCLCNTTVTRHA